MDSQLRVNLVDDSDISRALDHVSTSFAVRDGHDFIKQIFNRYGEYMEETANTNFIGGSPSWDNLFYNCFGQDVTKLLEQLQVSTSFLNGDTLEENHMASFQRLYGIGIVLYTTHLAEISRFKSIPAYILSVTDRLAELRPFYNISRQNLTPYHEDFSSQPKLFV
ncbi:hypothetical protein N7495_006867 [Penicillium taxi]|uniref:uncharacterized protein n=1 Tax=Penicillium taxi TaxID=168475 RepID=UPI0025450F29|nr:uncharacterized protein N7495_006867 [Penicillium taxi]KAJ5895176.1 hypothetical protein N7495_006867 [Penicillium taxi]